MSKEQLRQLARDALDEAGISLEVAKEWSAQPLLRSVALMECESGIREEVQTLCESALGRLDRNKEGITPEILRNSMEEVIRDLTTLPPVAGNAVASPEKFAVCEEVCAGPIFGKLADIVIDGMREQGIDGAAQSYNEFLGYSPERAEIVWQRLWSDESMRRALVIIIEEYGAPSAYADVRAFLTHEPKADQGLSSKSGAWLLLQTLRHAMHEAFVRRVLVRDREAGILDIPDAALDAAARFEELDRYALRDILGNELGQAQTAAPEKAEGYFRSHEILGGEGPNNFGYAYLSVEQTDVLSIDTRLPLCRAFRYMGKPYCAVPIGIYFRAREGGKFQQALDALDKLAAMYPGTPVEDYYRTLYDYFDYGENLDGTVEGYHDVCYEAEQQWVAYVKYAADHELPFLHIHPFEKYVTPSTKTHGLELGILDKQMTTVFAMQKTKIALNARKSLVGFGVIERYPQMADESLRSMREALVVSLSARFPSHAIMAQNVPNEQEGRENGVVIVCDTDYSWKYLRTRDAVRMRNTDPVGGLAAEYGREIQDRELFVQHYILEILAHELTHSLYRGNEQSFGSDGRGLAVKLIEEAKATCGVAFSFPPSRDECLPSLREIMPLILPWSLFRLRPALLDQHASSQYLREGAVQLEHLLTSGVLKIQHVSLDGSGEPVFLDRGETQNADFSYLRLDLGDRQLGSYLAYQEKFLRSLANVYYQTQHTELSADTVVSDKTDCDFWQALSRFCYDRQRKKEAAKPDGGDPAELARIDAAFTVIVPPENSQRIIDVAALVDYASGAQMRKMREAVARVHGFSLDDPALESRIAALREHIQSERPQIM